MFRGYNYRRDHDHFNNRPEVRHEGSLVRAPTYHGGTHDHVAPTYHVSAEHQMAPLVSGRIDWKEASTEHVFKVELPGVKKDEVKVDLQDNRVLNITAEKCVDMEDHADPWHRIERTCARFVRILRLPEDSKPHQTTACMENGVLTIRVPREEIRMNPHAMSTRIPVQ
ncbi:18.1 kDa class I heat shock protein-like [Punica granatum]|uniref:SHSP domain-containing protein n=2 Tax=Punica granatum TaxID=22663 RepID=A0A218W309_PUNGR|nr:18.1 kDa class I heat shock protein-like [Punica granatum]OWM67155.1 hypothetical protein CDL15_Pgr000607 [Punica granatum]PKI34848.1 hypothetical protein CRG98_044752 [Punica granatum]